MLYGNTPKNPLKKFARDLLRYREIILGSDGIIADADVYRAFVDAGYGNVTVADLIEVLREISREDAV